MQDLVVIGVRSEAPNIRGIVLARADGAPMETWQAGAHLDLLIPSGDTRSYSLVNTSNEAGATVAPRAYRLGVRLEEKSKGGSAFMHDLRVGDVVQASGPKNHFSLAQDEDGVVLVAGGIGITPIVSMAAELSAQGKSYRMIFVGRSRSHLAFLDETQRLCGAQLDLHGDDVDGFYNLPGLMTSLASQSLYVCGPTAMIDTAIAAAEVLGWQKGRLHFEVFNGPGAEEGDRAFDVLLARSGNRVHIPADQTILDALLAAGESPMFDCRRGDCGMCQVIVNSGVPDHRDYCLSNTERDSNRVIQICVSRSRTPVLELDL